MGVAPASSREYQFDSGEASAFWIRCVDSARIVWGNLSYEELLHTEGDRRRLIALVVTRYGVSRRAASRQVEEFLGHCGTWF